MKWIRTMTAALAMAAAFEMAAFSTSALAAGPQECPVPRGAARIALPSGMPPALHDAMGNVALPGQPFNAIDVYVKGEPGSRYLFVWNIGARWIVATEQGGIALRSAIFVYDLSKDGKSASLIDKRLGILSDACGTATALAGR